MNPDISPGAVASSEAETPLLAAYAATVEDTEQSRYCLEVRTLTPNRVEMEYRLRREDANNPLAVADFYRGVMNGLLLVFPDNTEALVDMFGSIVEKVKAATQKPEVPA